MADRGMSPSDFGLRVRSHPAGLVITATNKMRNGTRMTVSYSADISETISFDRALGGNCRNHELLGRFIASLGAPGPVGSDNRFWNRVWRGVAGEQVADLLGGMSVHQASRKARGDYLAGYIRSQNAIGGLVNWTVALISNPRGESVEVGGWEVHPGSQGSTSPGWVGAGGRVWHPPLGQPDRRDDGPHPRARGNGRWIRRCANILTIRRAAGTGTYRRGPVAPISGEPGIPGTDCSSSIPCRNGIPTGCPSWVSPQVFPPPRGTPQSTIT